MPRPRSALLLVAGRRHQLTGVLLRRTDVDERDAVLAEIGEHGVAARADVLVAVLRRVRGRRHRRLVARQVAPLVDPLLAAAVEDAHVAVPVDLEVPVRVRGEPVVLVAVDDDGRVVPDSAAAEEPLERVLLDHVALDRILQVVLPVQLDRSPDVALFVEIRVLVHLGDDDVVVVQVLGDPIGGHEHRLRIAVVGHLSSLKLQLLK